MNGPDYLEELARGETGGRAAHLRAWARYVAREGNEEYLAALERVRGAPAEAVLRALGTVWRDEPWVYGDWAKQAPPPERDGLSQWRVRISVLSREDPFDLDWPPQWEHPQVEPVSHYGWDDGDEGFHRVDVTPFIWAATEAQAKRLAEELLDAHLAGHYVLARRLRCARVEGEFEDKPRRPDDLEDGVGKVRWVLAESDGRRLRVLYGGRGAFERVEVAETDTTVTVSVYERFGPLYTPDGSQIAMAAIGVAPNPRAARVDLEAPVGDRPVIDGATGRRPDQLTLWDARRRVEREDLLAAIRSSRRRLREY